MTRVDEDGHDGHEDDRQGGNQRDQCGTAGIGRDVPLLEPVFQLRISTLEGGLFGFELRDAGVRRFELVAKGCHDESIHPRDPLRNHVMRIRSSR